MSAKLVKGYGINAALSLESYREFKLNHITEVANNQEDPRIRNGLIKHAQFYKALTPSADTAE